MSVEILSTAAQLQEQVVQQDAWLVNQWHSELIKNFIQLCFFSSVSAKVL